MTGIHLNHTLPWKDLLETCIVYKDPGVKMPIGECGLIHIVNKKIQLQVDHRKYLADQICLATDCKVTTVKIFRKNQTSKISLSRSGCYGIIPLYYHYNETERQVRQFFDCFAQAIREFAETERRKLKKRTVFQPTDEKDFNSYCDELWQKLKDDGKIGIPDEDHRDWCHCQLFINLIEAGEMEILLSFDDEEIRKVLRCQHGGQAVGNNFRFLKGYVLEVYLYTNLIIAAGFQDKPDEWGPMKPGSRYTYRYNLMRNCDGQTFLGGSRKFLQDEVYMKDWEAMKQLCKNCFQFLYYVDMLWKEVEGEKWGIEETKRKLLY